ncbi:MAG: 30S ribosomal protein S3 [Candidatus Hodarchaeota archaeon]
MAARKELLNRNLQYVQVSEFLNEELQLAGQGKVEIHKTPMGHRVVIHAVRLGMVIGRRGRNIRKITEMLEHLYGLETPQLEIKDLENPRLNSRVMAGRLISQIQKGFHFRRAGYALVRRIMSADARGCEITIKGKLTSQRARAEVFREGFVAKCGEPSKKYVEDTVMEVTLKQGVIGVHVKIMQPDAVLPDDAVLIPNVFGKPEDEEIVEEEELLEAELEEESLPETEEEPSPEMVEEPIAEMKPETEIKEEITKEDEKILKSEDFD